MDPIRTIRLRWVHGALGQVTYQLARFQFSQYAPHPWQPAINAYRCAECVRICVELAGVDHAEIDLQIEPQRLVLRGEREVPEPRGDQGHTLQTIAMEIDYGPFFRTIQFSPDIEVNVEKVSAEHANGLLWICLPLKKS
jgi:HSP20 family molecular chaperone IbpA